MVRIKCLAPAIFILVLVHGVTCESCRGEGTQPLLRAAAALVGLDSTSRVDLEVFESDPSSGLPLSVSVRFGRDK